MHFSRALSAAAPAAAPARRAISRVVATAVVAALAFAATVSGAASPAAAAASVMTHAELQAALTVGGTVVLGASISGDGLAIPAPNDVVLDLAGFTLAVEGFGEAGSPGGKAGIEVPVGATFTINGPGVLRASGGGGGAGIGGSDGQANGAITINGGTIEAAGEYHSAGIGTGVAAPTGAELITINGGTVTAVGGYIAAGLGGGAWSAAPPITIDGGTVTAGRVAPYEGMGIGAGVEGTAATITINSGQVWSYGRLWCGATLGAYAVDVEGTCIPSSAVDITIGPTAVVNLQAVVDYGASSLVQFWRDGEGSFSNAGTLNVQNARLAFPVGSSASNTGTINGTVDGPLSGNSFVLSFDGAGGAGGPGAVRVLAPTLGAAGLAVPSAPTRAGFTFDGWWSSSIPGAGSRLTTATALSTTTWYARWVAPLHAITFDATGGSPVASVSIRQGDFFVAPAAPTRAGYAFSGWYTGVSGGAEWTSSTTVSGAVTLYARWVTAAYVVSFSTGTGGSAVSSQTVEHGSSAALPTPPTRTGYSFVGWVTTAGGATAWDASSAVTGNVTVYARWAINTYTVTFATNGGTAVASQTIEHGSSAVLPVQPTRTGYSFVDWVTTASGTTAWDASSAVTGNVTVYARWAINSYTVSFTTGTGGSAVSSQTVEHGSSAALPTPPTRTGYSFVGWVTTAGGATAWDASSAVTGNVTVYARWAINTYTVTFATGASGSFEPSQAVDHGGRASVPSHAPTRANHSFVGWFTSESGGAAWDGSAAVTGNVTVFARWLIDSYSVSFDTSPGGSIVASQSIDHGQAATLPSAPTRAGHVFAGWFTAATGGVEWDDAAPVTGAVTLHAAWDALVPTTTSVSIEDDLVAIPAGKSVTIFGTVSPATAVGTIELFEDGVSIGSGAVVGGVFQINTVALAGGDYVYTGVFTPGEPRFLTSTSAPVDLVVNPLRPRVPAPAPDTAGLLDEVDINGWPVHPLPGGAGTSLGKNVPWASALDSFVDVYVYSTAQWLGTYAVVGGKVDSGYWALMPTLTPGLHHLVFVGQTSGSVSVYDFSVPVSAAAAPGGSSVLASTGAEPAPWATIGLALLLLGGGLVARRRARTA